MSDFQEKLERILHLNYINKIGLEEASDQILKLISEEIIGGDQEPLAEYELQMIYTANGENLSKDEIRNADEIIREYQNKLRAEQRKALGLEEKK